MTASEILRWPQNAGYDWTNAYREIIGGGLIYLGRNNIPVNGKTGGATPGTSRVSSYLSQKFPQNLTKTENKRPWKVVKKTVPKKVLGQPLRSPIVGRMAGRFVPILGEGLLIWDFVDLFKLGVEDQIRQIQDNVRDGKDPLDGVYVPGLGDFYTPFYGF